MGFAAFAFGAYAQPRVIDSITLESERLYQLENACWRGTEVFFTSNKQQRTQAAGCFSYHNSATQVSCVFYSTDTAAPVLSTIHFDTSFRPSSIRIDKEKRRFTPLEARILRIKMMAMDEIDHDSIFQLYENTSFSIIPVIDSFSAAVYVITAPEVKGVVLFGNDYLLRFNNNDSLLQKRALHRDMIAVDFAPDAAGELTETYHTHNPAAGKYITATDICTLRLYGRYTHWKQHVVLSPLFASVWDVEQNVLSVFTAEQWNRMNNSKKNVSRRD